MKDAFAVVMAGGLGTRFWPLSRRAWPKQFLRLANPEESLLQGTVRRICRLVPLQQVLVVTSESHADATAQQLPDLPRENILAEPVGRNTAPCVAWAAAHVRRREPTAVMAVLPADPHIGDEAKYLEAIGVALSAAKAGALVTVGVEPTRPETGYGYIEMGEAHGPGVRRARRFVEKPDRQTAERFLAAGNYLWNSGMFFFRTDVILDEMGRHLPDLHAAMQTFDRAAQEGREAETVKQIYGDLPSISIDNGVMEKADDILVVPAAFGWHDVGSWTTAWDLADKDPKGNAISCRCIALGVEQCYVRAPQEKMVALVGVRDLVIVDTKDALLVMHRDQAQQLRSVIERLQAEGEDHFL